ncbi:MAG: folylpolyglutamate synthase/dihydrofolate synthase family protein [Planctomycetota bacterium]
MDDYQSSIDYLYAQINYERIGTTAYTANNFRLDRMRRLMELLGDPQDSYRIIHVAGTKGKGTVSHLFANVLLEAGYRCGLYTSPHLLRLEERFLAGSNNELEPPTESEMVSLIDEVRVASETIESTGPTATRPTFFEQTTALAFLHFARRQCNAVVLEVGLGGRLDSTNICQPDLTIVTSISLDHQKQLGDTIAAIAAEKAGIIKPSIPVINAAYADDAIEVVNNRADQSSAPCIQIGRDVTWQWSPIAQGDKAQSDHAELASDLEPSPSKPSKEANAEVLVCWRGTDDSNQITLPLRTPLLGRHQAPNVAAVAAGVRILQQNDWAIHDEALRKGIASAQPPARLQCVGHSPIQIIDTAHNPSSIRAGLDALNSHFSGLPIVSVFASSKDKDYAAMLEELLPSSDSVILTEYLNNPRSAPVAELVACAEAIESGAPKSKVMACRTPEDAWSNALNTASSLGGLVYVAGSFFLAAEMIPLMSPSGD